MPEQEWAPEVLDAAEAAVREFPGSTAAEIAVNVRRRLLSAGRPAPLLPRPRSLALLRELEARNRVTRRSGQAMVTFWPAEEGTGAPAAQSGADRPAN